MATIVDVQGYEVLDSRGNPTTAAQVVLDNGSVGKAYVPSGASTGVHEALELRDSDADRYHGKGVLQAIENINGSIREALIGMEATAQADLDQAMLDADGTPNKGTLGANAILAVSLATARAAADSEEKPLYQYLNELYQAHEEVSLRLPMPSFNVLNGGAHADSGLDVQEFMLQPQAETVAETVRAGSEIYHSLKKLLATEGYTTSVGDEGGFAPKLPENGEALVILKRAIEAAGYSLGENVHLALDVAATEFYADGEYTMGGQALSAQDMIELYQQWIKEYSIVSIEDPFAEDDFAAWADFMKALDPAVRVVGDDLLVTNVERIQTAIDQKLCNAVLIKPNQIGSLTETMQAIAMSHANGMTTMISHRSGDTGDTFIADLGVATACEYIKSGALSRAERISKYNRLIEIERELEQ